MKNPNITPRRGIHLAAGLLSAILVGAINLHAADRTWNGAGDGTTMNSGANWVGGVPPVAGDALFFDGSTGLSPNNNYANNTAFAGITFNSGAGAFTLTGSTINLLAGITNNSSTLQTIAVTQIFLNGTNRNFVANADLLFTSQVNCGNGNIKFIKSGTGTVTLGGATDNGFCGATNNQGTLILAKASGSSVAALGGDTTINTNGILVFSGTFNNEVFSGASIILNGGKLQMQETNLTEEIKMLRGTNPVSIVENGLANSTNVLQVGGGRNGHAIYGGILQDGSAGVLGFADSLSGNWIVLTGTNNTYSGPTIVNCNDGTGTSPARLIVDGVHVGGSVYTISGRSTTAANTGVLGGKGFISAITMNFGANTALSPGGALSDESNTSTFSDTTAILTISNAAVNLNTATSTLDVGLSGTTAGTSYDQVNIVGTGSFSNNAANLKISLGFTPATGDKFTLVKVQGTNSANNAGIFASLNGIVTDLSQGAVFIDPVTAKRFQISYRAEGSTFDMGAGNGNDIMIQALADAAGPITWRGNGGNNFWDFDTTADWVNTNNVAVTFTNNPVVFDNSGASNLLVNLTATVTPSSVLFNSTSNYVIWGSGSLSGTVVVTKTNTGTVAIVNENSGLIGTTVIKTGVFQIGTNGTSGSWAGAITVNTNGVLAINRSDDVVFTNNVSGTGSAGLLHNGSGALVINAVVPFSGRSTNVGGVFQLGDGTSGVGSIAGDVHVDGTNVLRYYFAGNSTTANPATANTFSGNGTVLWDEPLDSATSSFDSIGSTLSSSNFTGTHIIGYGVTVHALNNNPGYAFGSNSVVIVTNTYSQVWLDSSPIPYNQSYVISGSGTPVMAPGGTDVNPPYGAIKLFNNTISGSITLVGDARIGGSSSGGTLTGPIIGNGHQLEIFGDNTVGFPFVLSVSNSLNNWGNTLITWGSLRAINAGAISTNAMTIDLNGQLQVFGNTVNVNSLNNGVSGAGVVYNMNSSTVGTLVVGADGSSSTFDGTFGNGSSRALNLTKVGAGTLTLSALSTNTGVVTVSGGTLALTGSGSFDNATNLAVASGATLNVSGRSDGTLTLTANQTLQHSGSSVGAITIAGNANMGSGILLLGLNRANAPATNDSLVVSGTLTGGGTLTVTNLGLALHVNDSFQLFSSGVSGFAYSLQTTDTVNNVIYSWNNTVGADGKIKVASVTPMVNTNAPRVQVSVTGNILHLGWPTNAGWTLLTNSVSLTVTNQWFPYPNSANLTNADITMDPTKTNVFFKMQYPYP